MNGYGIWIFGFLFPLVIGVVTALVLALSVQGVQRLKAPKPKAPFLPRGDGPAHM